MTFDVNPQQGDLATARGTVEGVMASCEQRLPTEASLRIALGWTDDALVCDEMGGCSGICVSGDAVEIVFNSRVDGWTTALEGVAARLYGQAYVRSRFPDGTAMFWWQDLLEKACGEVLAEELAPAATPAWASVEQARLADWWEDIRSNLGESFETPLLAEDAIDEGTGEATVPSFLPEAYAAVLATELHGEVELAAFPSRTRSDVEAHLDTAFR